MFDRLLMIIIAACCVYECWILTKEFKYDEQKDLEKKQRRTKTTKKTTTSKDGTNAVEESTETIEPMPEEKKP